MQKYFEPSGLFKLPALSQKEIEQSLSRIERVYNESHTEKGPFPTKFGEISRAVVRLNHQFYNNGYHFVMDANNCGAYAEYLIAVLGGDVGQLILNQAEAKKADDEQYKLFLGHLSQEVFKRIIRNADDAPNTIDCTNSYTPRWQYDVCEMCESFHPFNAPTCSCMQESN